MPSILDSGKAATVTSELDAVAKRKLRGQVGLDGQIEGSLSTTWRRLTFTAYVKALVKGPRKSIGGGVRVERDF